MNIYIIIRYLQRIVTFIPRIWHRNGFGVHSPHDYELVKDVLFEKMAYYAYEDQSLKTNAEKQLYRLKLRFGDRLVHATSCSTELYEQYASSSDDGKVLVVEGISGYNHLLWRQIINDSRARVTFDMGNRGLVLFDKKRVKQNYLL